MSDESVILINGAPTAKKCFSRNWVPNFSLERSYTSVLRRKPRSSPRAGVFVRSLG
jgi:hypothetical protein